MYILQRLRFKHFLLHLIYNFFYDAKGQLSTVYYPYTKSMEDTLKKEAEENRMPIKRESEAISDLEGAGLPMIFVPYDK